MIAGGCAVEDTPQPIYPSEESYGVLLLSVGLSENKDTILPYSRSPFDDYDNEDDRWGIDGENMETLRVIIVDGAGFVEHNSYFTLENATSAGVYKFQIKDDDNKTIILIANEGNYFLDEPGMEISGATTSLPSMLAGMCPGAKVDIGELSRLTLSLRHNTPDSRGQSLRTPLPITGIYTEYIPSKAKEIRRTYNLIRAAVKYTFRIVNLSEFEHTVNAVRLDRVADTEFLFPDFTLKEEPDGTVILESYRTPEMAKEDTYTANLLTPLSLPSRMEKAVQIVEPVYLPEGLNSESAQKISLTLDGRPLEEWKELKWIRPGESITSARPMTDLPRNTHVVVNITLKRTGEIDLIAEVQPYSCVDLHPNFGLDRDDDGNIIITRFEDGTYIVMDDTGSRIKKDPDGDIILKTFRDGSILCIETIYKDYIHDDYESDYYEYVFEKDAPGGNMVILRQISDGSTNTVPSLAAGDDHEHGLDDKPRFILDKDGYYYFVTYDSSGNPTISRNDMFGNEIIQANGLQFRYIDEMSDLMGTYMVKLPDGTEELRNWQDGSKVETWNPEIRNMIKKYGESSLKKMK